MKKDPTLYIRGDFPGNLIMKSSQWIQSERIKWRFFV